MSFIEHFVTHDGTVRAASVIATDVVGEAKTIHESSTLATAAMGRSLIAAGLLASFLKDEGRIALHFKGDGPLGQIFAEGDRSGAVRGFVANPQAQLPHRNDGKINVGGGIGSGVLTVSTITPPELKPYTGTVNLQSGEIAEDIAYYLYQSHQIPSIVALGVLFNSDGSVQVAGGLLVEVMPGASEATLSILENKVKTLKPVTESIQSGSTASDLIFDVFDEFKFRSLDNKTQVKYTCKCNIDRVERALMIAGPEELNALLKKNTPAEVRCDFCGRKYGIPVNRLQHILQRITQTK